MEMATLVRDNSQRKSSTHIVYQPQGGGPNVYFPASLLGENAPESIEIPGVTFTPASARKTPVQKMTPEERKAAAAAAREARKNETPQQKAERAQAAAKRAAERAAKLAAAAAEPAHA